MSLSNSVGKICTFLGKSNSPLIATLTISAFKGVLRPTFTMLDKKSEPDTKKYVATRECLTEGVALATYCLSNKLVSNLAQPICQKAGKTSANDVAKVKAGLSVLSIWACAGVAIPLICNAVLPPIMKLLFKKKKHPHHHKKNLNIQEQPIQLAPQSVCVKTPQGKIESVYYPINMPMKVGGR